MNPQTHSEDTMELDKKVFFGLFALLGIFAISFAIAVWRLEDWKKEAKQLKSESIQKKFSMYDATSGEFRWRTPSEYSAAVLLCDRIDPLPLPDVDLGGVNWTESSVRNRNPEGK